MLNATQTSKTSHNATEDQRVRPWSFTAFWEVIRSWMQVARRPKPSMRLNIYTHCSELPLFNFIKLICNGDLSYLLIDRSKHLPDDAAELWGAIFAEYLSISKSEDVKYLTRLQEDIQKISAKVFVINASLYVLYEGKNQTLVEVMGENGFNVDATGDLEKYYASLSRIGSQVKGLQLQLSMKSKELEELRKSHAKTKINEDYFTRVLLYLSKNQGYHINAKDITVSEFVELQDYVKKQVEWQTKK